MITINIFSLNICYCFFLCCRACREEMCNLLNVFHFTSISTPWANRGKRKQVRSVRQTSSGRTAHKKNYLPFSSISITHTRTQTQTHPINESTWHKIYFHIVLTFGQLCVCVYVLCSMLYTLWPNVVWQTAPHQSNERQLAWWDAMLRVWTIAFFHRVFCESNHFRVSFVNWHS